MNTCTAPLQSIDYVSIINEYMIYSHVASTKPIFSVRSMYLDTVDDHKNPVVQIFFGFPSRIYMQIKKLPSLALIRSKDFMSVYTWFVLKNNLRNGRYKSLRILHTIFTVLALQVSMSFRNR
jgi:hypothetical protein